MPKLDYPNIGIVNLGNTKMKTQLVTSQLCREDILVEASSLNAYRDLRDLVNAGFP